MSFEARLQAALARCAAAGIWKSNYAPPLFRLAWRLGLQPRPPHFLEGSTVRWLYGTWFAAFFGVGMWLWRWRRDGMAWWLAAVFAVLAGAWFAWWMSAYYGRQIRRYRLATWAELDADIPRAS